MPLIIRDNFDGKTKANYADVPYSLLPQEQLLTLAKGGDDKALEALLDLHSISKGDVAGHSFHGNQWVKLGVEGAILQHNKDIKQVLEGNQDFEIKIVDKTHDRAYKLKDSSKLTYDGATKLLVTQDLAKRLGTKFDDKLVDGAIVAPNKTFQQLLDESKKTDYIEVVSANEHIGGAIYRGYVSKVQTNIFDGKTPAQQYKDYQAQIKAGNGNPAEQIFRANDPALKDAVREMGVSDLITKWAQTSNDSSPTSLAMQQAVADQFSLKNTADWEMSPELKKDVADDYAQNGEMYRAIAQAQYDSTQELLKSQGIDEVQLFRGYKFPKSETPDWAKQEGLASVSTRPLSSFSSNMDKASEFAFKPQNVFGGEGEDFIKPEDMTNISGAVITGMVPADKIFSLPTTGFGCANENEVTVLGDTQQWQVLTSADQLRNIAPFPADTVKKGDFDGHPFRGNQYQGGLTEANLHDNPNSTEIGLIHRWVNGTGAENSMNTPTHYAQMREAVAKFGQPNPELYRGVRAIGQGLYKGQVNHENTELTSWTTDKAMAERFAGQWGTVRVLPAGVTNALNIDKYLPARDGTESEWVVDASTIPAKYSYGTSPDQSVTKGDVEGHEFHGNQYETVAGQIKPEELKLPKGWHVDSQDEKTYTLKSDKGNSATFNKGAVPYKIGTMGFAGGTKDLMENGEKEVWTPENPIAVSAMKSLDAQATGKRLDFATSAGEGWSSYGAATNPNDTSVIKIGKLSTIEGASRGNLPSNVTGIIADKDLFGTSRAFGDKTKSMEVTITHELGHIDFTTRGLTVDDIKKALEMTKNELGIEKMPNWDRLENNYIKKVADAYTKKGEEMPEDLLKARLGRGSAPQSDTGKKWLQSVGATKYGSTRLQECYAECYAVWHTPNFAITPLVANMASVAGWGERPKQVSE